MKQRYIWSYAIFLAIDSILLLFNAAKRKMTHVTDMLLWMMLRILHV